MKILWLPHAPLRSGRTRGEHLIEQLARDHEMRVLSFRTHPSKAGWRYATDLLRHRSGRGPGYDEIAFARIPKMNWLNQRILNWTIRREIASTGCDVFVSSPIVHIAGYVDFEWIRPRAAIVCDYLDGVDWQLGHNSLQTERHWVAAADSVLCVSHRLNEQSKQLNPHSYYVPNGVDLGRYRQFRATHTARECKSAIGIDPDAYVVSIIGMTCSPRLYFVDAALELARRGLNIRLLLVGDSPLLPAIRERAGSLGDRVLITGPVPYEQVLPYFMASDVGLNVVDDDSYYHLQSPLKIFEYAALGKPVVVAPRLDEVVRTKLPNVVFCAAAAEPLAAELARLRSTAGSIEVNLERYDWKTLAHGVEAILKETRSRVAPRIAVARAAQSVREAASWPQS